jgi:xanthine dehydrogenase iron-sulfur cluster and FAD-binding subunit A
MARPAAQAGVMEGRGATATYVWMSGWVPFNVLWNSTGQPAASVPAGLGAADELHPVARAFYDEDAFQCGYCTPGQICSAVGMMDEAKSGAPSFVTDDLEASPELTDDEIRERMSGNLCRCAAYANIVSAIGKAAGR